MKDHFFSSTNAQNMTIGLSLALVLQCAALLYQTTLGGSSIGTFFFMEMEFHEGLAYGIDRYLALALFSIALWVAFSVSFLGEDLKRKLLIPLAFISFSFLFLASVTLYNGGSFGARFSLISHLARISLPLAILGFLSSTKEVVGFLRIVIALTFAAHGIEALLLHPEFIDYLLVAFSKIFHIDLSESKAQYLLRGIGLLDIFVALAILRKESRKIVLWMTFWGFITALMRILYLGLEQWQAFAIRSSHFAIPFAIYLYWRFEHQEKDKK